jgi:hypothetical protein
VLGQEVVETIDLDAPSLVGAGWAVPLSRHPPDPDTRRAKRPPCVQPYRILRGDAERLDRRTAEVRRSAFVEGEIVLSAKRAMRKARHDR